MIQATNSTKQYDQFLKSITDNQKNLNQQTISKIMKQGNNIQGYNLQEPKQRWYNLIDPSNNIQEWTEQEQQILFNKHNIYGNKWAKISTYLHGRSDNNIKNHFYSTLRKAFRGLNRFISGLKKRGEIKPFKNIVMTKIISLAQLKIQNHQSKQIQQINNGIDVYSRCVQLKNRLLKFAGKYEKGEESVESIEQLIRDINKVTKIKFKKLKRKITKNIQTQIFPEQDLKFQISNKKVQPQIQPIQNISFKLQKKQSFKKCQRSPKIEIPIPAIKTQEEQQKKSQLYEIPTMSSFSFLLPNLNEPSVLYRNSQLDVSNNNEYVYFNFHPYMMNNQFYQMYNSQQFCGINSYSYLPNEALKKQN